METLITFKTAKLAKDKKFNVECFNYYQDSHRAGVKNINSPLTNSLIDELHEEDKYCIIFYTAPSQSNLANWLREEHNIDVLINKAISGVYYYIIWQGSKKLKPVGRFYKYEDCFEEGLFEALNLI